MIRSIKGAGSALYVADLTADAALKPILSSTGRPDRLQYCMWATSTRLVCDMATTLMTNASRMVTPVC